MTHLDAGGIVTVRDGQPIQTSDREHVTQCPACQIALDEARHRSVAIESVLKELDRPFDLGSAKADVQGRLDAGPWKSGSRRGSIWGSGLGRAAAVLLLATGAASALPGSPVRTWIAGERTERDSTGTVAQELASTERSGIAVPVGDDGIRVVVTGASPGSELEVVWVAGATARISAEWGSSFSFGGDLLEARLAEGPVRVELPRNATAASVEVDGQVYVQLSGDLIRLGETPSGQAEGTVTFTIPKR